MTIGDLVHHAMVWCFASGTVESELQLSAGFASWWDFRGETLKANLPGASGAAATRLRRPLL